MSDGRSLRLASAQNIFCSILFFTVEGAKFIAAISRYDLVEVDTSMNTTANAPVPGSARELAEKPAAALSAVADLAATVVPDLPGSTWERVKDILVTIYAYGLLAFGIFFPLLLVAWRVIFEPAAR